MRNLYPLDLSKHAINSRFDAHHPDGKLIAHGGETKCEQKCTRGPKRIDKKLVRQLAVYSRFMLILDQLKF